MLVLFLIIWIVQLFSIVLTALSHFGYPLCSSVLEIHRLMHTSFGLLHKFILDEDFTADCSGVRGFCTLPHICFMDFRRSDFSSTLFIFGLRASRLHLCYLHYRYKRSGFAFVIFIFRLQAFRLRLCYIHFKFQAFRLCLCLLDFKHSNFTFTIFIFRFQTFKLQICCLQFWVLDVQTSPCFLYFGFHALRLRLCYLQFGFWAFRLHLLLSSFWITGIQASPLLSSFSDFKRSNFVFSFFISDV